jgi:hypothetical protein
MSQVTSPKTVVRGLRDPTSFWRIDKTIPGGLATGERPDFMAAKRGPAKAHNQKQFDSELPLIMALGVHKVSIEAEKTGFDRYLCLRRPSFRTSLRPEGIVTHGYHCLSNVIRLRVSRSVPAMAKASCVPTSTTNLLLWVCHRKGRAS